MLSSSLLSYPDNSHVFALARCTAVIALVTSERLEYVCLLQKFSFAHLGVLEPLMYLVIARMCLECQFFELFFPLSKHLSKIELFVLETFHRTSYLHQLQHRQI
jgi:hypothetical protein